MTRLPRRRAVGGWTLIELLVVMMVLGLLANIAVLKYRDMTRSAYSGFGNSCRNIRPRSTRSS